MYQLFPHKSVLGIKKISGTRKEVTIFPLVQISNIPTFVANQRTKD